MDVSPEDISEIQDHARQPLSLDEAGEDRDDAPLAWSIEDRGDRSPSTEGTTVLSSEQLSAMLAELTAREADVLRLRFGPIDGQRHTLGQISRAYGLNREIVQRIETAAIAKLRGQPLLRPGSARAQRVRHA